MLYVRGFVCLVIIMAVLVQTNRYIRQDQGEKHRHQVRYVPPKGKRPTIAPPKKQALHQQSGMKRG